MNQLEVDRTLLIVLLAIVGALCAGAIVIGAITLHNTHEINKSEKALCESNRKGRIQGNVRAEVIKLIEATVITANRKAERTLKGYKISPLVTKLKDHPPAIPNPVPGC